MLAGNHNVTTPYAKVPGKIERRRIAHGIDETKRFGQRLGSIYFIDDLSGLTEIAVLRRQVDGRIRLKGGPDHTLTGAKEGKEDESVYPSEMFIGKVF
jgi:hypothetical protein